MFNYDKKRERWRVVVIATAPGVKPRRRAYRDVKAPDNREGYKAAELVEAKLKIEVAENREREWPGGRTGVTFAATADGWVARNSPRWSPKTTKEIKYALRRSILPTIGSTPLDAVTPRQIETMYAGWHAAYYSPSTTRRWHGIVAAIFADAERLDELRGRNPMTRVRPAGGKARERRVPSPEDVRKIIASAPSPESAVFFELAAATGARRGTLIALRWRDVDIAAGTVSCVEAAAEGCDGQVLKSTKADRAYAVGIAGPALEALHEHRRRAIESAMGLGIAGEFESLFVFSRDGGGTPWNVSWPTHAWFKAVALARVAHCTLHDVRHFSATNLLAAGVPVRVVADRLGCTEGNVIRTYSHRVVSAEDARAAQVLAEVLSL
jgi:integrase